MQFKTVEELFDHRVRVHVNNRDIYNKKDREKAVDEPTRAPPPERRPLPPPPPSPPFSASDDNSGDSEADEEPKAVENSSTSPPSQLSSKRGLRRAPPGSPRTELRRARNRARYRERRAEKLRAAQEPQPVVVASSDGSSDSDGSTSDSSAASDDSSASSASSHSSRSALSDDSPRSFDAFGRAAASPHSDSASTSDDDGDAASSLSDAEALAFAPNSSARRPPRRRLPPQPRIRDSDRSDRPLVPRPPPTPQDESPAAQRAKVLRANSYLFKWRFQPSVPHHLLRCLLCQGGPSHESGLLLRCHGKCGLAMHAACMEMAWVPSGPWYCSEQCDKGLGIIDGEMDEVQSIRIMRRWRQWWERRKKNRSRPAVPDAKQRGRKADDDDGDATGVAPRGVRFIVRTAAEVSTAAARVQGQSRWAALFPSAPKPASAKVRRIFRPLSLAAPDPFAASHAAAAAAAAAPPAPPSMTPTDQLPPPAGARPAEPKARPRSRHLMFSLKQPRLDPTELSVVTAHPARYSHAAKGSLPITSSRSLRGAHSSLRSAAFLLSLRVPDRDPERAICCVCEDGDSVEDNPIVMCDGECRMAYHRYCVGLKQMPGEDEEWLCSEVCKKAKQRQVAVEDEVVVRLVQSRRDEYDERGPYDEKGGEGSAALLELFAQLDAQYFCPRMMWRLWKKGKWRMQHTNGDHLVDLMEVIGGVSEPGWDVQRIQPDEEQSTLTSPSPSPSPALPSATASPPPPTERSTAEAEAAAEPPTRPDKLSVKVNTPLSISAPILAAFDPVKAVAEPATASAADAPVCKADHQSRRSQSCPPSLADDVSTSERRDALDSVLPINHSASHQPFSFTADQQGQSSSASSSPTPDGEEEGGAPLLSEECRLLAAYSAQVVANNQVKAKLIAAFHAHRVNPESLPTLSERQRREEDVLRTYLEYEEKMGVGSDKDRARRLERCHVNYCSCQHCFNAHLKHSDVDSDSDDDRDIDLTQDDAGEGDDAQPDMEEDDDVRVEEPPPSSAAFSLPPAPPAVSGDIDPTALLRFVHVGVRKREQALALAKIVGGPELTPLLEAGKAGRTLTRGQMKSGQAKKKKKADEDASTPTPAPPATTTATTRRRSAAASAAEGERSASPGQGARRTPSNQEVKALLPWAWDRTYAARMAASGEVAPAVPQPSAPLTRGHRRLRITQRGVDVLPQPVVVRYHRDRSARRPPASTSTPSFPPPVPSTSRSVARSTFLASVSLALRRQSDRTSPIAPTSISASAEPGRLSASAADRNGWDSGAEREKETETVKLLLEGDEMNVLPVVHTAVARLRSSRGRPSLEVRASAIAATTAATALAAELVQQIRGDRRREEGQREADPFAFPPAEPQAMDDVSSLALLQAEAAQAEERRAEQRRHDQDRRRRLRPTMAERVAANAARRQRKLQQRDLQREQMLAEYRAQDRVVEVGLPVDGEGEARVEVAVLLDYPWSKKRKFDEIARLTQPYLSDGPRAPFTDASQPAPAVEENGSAEAVAGPTIRTRRSTRPSRSMADGEAEAVALAPLATAPPTEAVGAAPASSAPAAVAGAYHRTEAVAALLRALPAAEPLLAEYPQDANGLPVVTNPIDDGVCIKCGDTGDMILCDGHIGDLPCHLCWHLYCTERTTKPKGDWICPKHSCTECRRHGKTTRDKVLTHHPFAYCQWCDRSWCQACIVQVVQRGDAVDFTPIAPSASARFVTCSDCLEHFKSDYGADFTQPERQRAAHLEKLVEQLKLQLSERGVDVEAADDLETEDDEAEAAVSRSKRPGKRKQPPQRARARPKVKAQQVVPHHHTNGHHHPPPSYPDVEFPTSEAEHRRPAKRQRARSQLPARGATAARDEEEDDEEMRPLNGFLPHQNGRDHPLRTPVSPDSGDEDSSADSEQPPLVLQPCVTRSEIETAPTRRTPVSREPDSFAYPDRRPADDDIWRVKSPAAVGPSGKLLFSRRAVEMVGGSPARGGTGNGVSPISLPSPSSPSLVPGCLSTSSTASAGSPASGAPLLRQPPQSSLSLLSAPVHGDALRVVQQRGEKRTRYSGRMEVDGDAHLARLMQAQLDQESRAGYPRKRR